MHRRIREARARREHSAERSVTGEADASHAGVYRERSPERLVEGARPILRVSALRRIHRSQKHIVLREPGVDLSEVVQRLAGQEGRGHEND